MLPAELPDGDQETDFVIDAIRAGYYGTHLTGELEHYRAADDYLDVHRFNPSTVFLQPLPGGEDQHCWAEVHGEIDYQLQAGVFNTMWDWYECYSTRRAQHQQSLLQLRRRHGHILSEFPRRPPGGYQWLGRERRVWGIAGSDPLAPISGDDVVIQFPRQMTGRIQLLIAKQGRLQGEVSIGPEQMRSLKDQLYDYEVKHGELRLPPDDDDDGGGAAA